MRAGAEMFLDACTEPEVQRIVLLDGPAVLGWDRWREIAAEHGLGLIEASLAAAIEAGEIDAQPVQPLAHVLMGALDEAAMLVARAEDPERAGRGRPHARRPARGLSRDWPRRRLVGARSRRRVSQLGAGDPARLLLRVHAHVGELQRRARVGRLGRDRRPRPRTALTSKPRSLRGQRFGRAPGHRARSAPRRRSSSTQNSSPPIR